MGKRTRSLVAVVMMLVMLLSQSVALAEDAGVYVLNISGEGIKSELKLTIEDLKAMPEQAQIDEAYIYNSKKGQQSVELKGVSLAYLFKDKAGLNVENAEVVFEASDGYPIDPQDLQDVLNQELKYVLAYEINEALIDNDDNPDTEEIVVYRKQKEEGEFNTVFKLVNKITITEVEGSEATEETEEAEEVEETESTEDIVFTDITEEFKYAETAIMDLAKRGIIDGKGDGLYAPGDKFTRAEFCKIVVESLEYEKSEYTGGFSDVEAGYWAEEYIQTALDKGLFIGSDGKFMPLKVITRQEMAVVAARAAVLAEKPGSEKISKFVMDKSKYLDKADVPAWANNEVAWLEAQGAFQGIADEKFYPTKVVNRAEAALIIYNTLFK